MHGSIARRLPALLLVLAAVAAPRGADAQSMVDLYSDLFTFGDCGAPLCLDVPTSVHGQHYNPSIVQGENNLIAFLTGSVGATLGSLPFAAATGGVTFQFVEGAPVATSVSPGPIFADRAQTLGAGRAVVGVNVSAISLSRMRGTPMSDLQLRFTHENVDDAHLGDPVFENDFIGVDLDLQMDLLVTSLFASWGVTDGLDVSVQVPFVRSSLEGRSVARVHHWTDVSPHFFRLPSGDSTATREASASGESTGLGDMTVRMKAALVRSERGGVSMIADVRLPTGDADDFHGSGDAALRVLGVASHQVGDFTPHLNLGVVIREGRRESNSVLAVAGFDHMLADAATLVVELMGDFQVGDSPLSLPAPVVFTEPAPARTLEMTNLPDRADHLLDVGLGFKFRLPGDARLVTSAVVPFLEGGARPSVMWTLGVDRSF